MTNPGPPMTGRLQTYGSAELHSEHDPIRVIAVTYEDGEWSVDTEVDDPEPGDDPSKVRLALAYAEDTFEVDVPVEVLQRIGEKIGEL
jgi:hypothetical protein